MRRGAADRAPSLDACVSWHELASRFLFSNARAYVGTLFSVSDIEAEAIVIKLLDKYSRLPFWNVFRQRAVLNSDERSRLRQDSSVRRECGRPTS
jgi:hypothetical protein